MTTPSPAHGPGTDDPRAQKPWRALWSLVLGFFMILVDTTIVSVATPAIITGLQADLTTTVWVTSAYLLAFAVPLLITGRLGDRFGPKRVYLAGLVVFTIASLLCGLSPTVEVLIAARVLQGLGAAMMTPQSMAVITRLFPPERRGVAMGVWGSVAGIATLVGPILGGVLTSTLGWEWIFFVNLPVGVIAFVLCLRFVPRFDRMARRLDWPGIVLSASAMFLIIFALQEGGRFAWGSFPLHLAGTTLHLSLPLMLGIGIAAFIAFIVWQRRTRSDPLVPLDLFRDRNFSLGNIAIAAMGFTITAQMLPIMIYLQEARSLDPTQAALYLAPTAVISMVLPPVIGRVMTVIDPKWLAMFGFTSFGLGLFWFSRLMVADAPLWMFLLPAVLFGLSHSCIWSPVSVTSTRSLGPARAGAGSGVYNTTRQVGAVLGAAAMAATMEATIAHRTGTTGAVGGAEGGLQGGDPAMLEGLGWAMGTSMLLPAAVILIGFVAAAFFRPAPAEHMRRARS